MSGNQNGSKPSGGTVAVLLIIGIVGLIFLIDGVLRVRG